MPDQQPSVHALFLCTHNSARSQMAEALLRYESAGRVAAASAGTEPTSLHPLALRAMDELGIDIRSQRAKPVDEVIHTPFDYVITVCDQAAERCPVFPEPARRLHWGFEDPAAAEGSEDERLEVFRRVRDGLRDRVERFAGEISVAN